MSNERVIILIDGSNFYYSTVKKRIKIDFEKLVNFLVGDRKLIKAYYYVAPLDIKADEEKYWAHQRFLNKLGEIDGFEVVLCNLKKIRIDGKYAYFVKGDDVKMSNKLIMGAVDDLYDVAVVVSGDEDFVDSITIVRKRYGKRVENAYFSRSSSVNLRKACDGLVNLSKMINKFEIKSSALSEDHAEH